MQLDFERRELRLRAEDDIRLRATIVNDGAARLHVSYDVETASDPATNVRWAVAGPSSLEPGQQATVVVTLHLDAEATPHPDLSVRLSVAPAAGLGAAAETVVRFIDDSGMCATFATPPTLTLAADGSITGSLLLLNCGGVKVSTKLVATDEGGLPLRIDTPQLTLDTGAGPVKVTVTITRSDEGRLQIGQRITLRLLHGSVVLDSTAASVGSQLLPPSGRGLRHRLRPAAVIGVLLALLVVASPVVADYLMDSAPDAATDTGSDGDTDPGADGDPDGEPPPDAAPGSDTRTDPGATSDPTSRPTSEPTSEPMGEPVTIDSMTVTFLEERCAVQVDWTLSDAAPTLLTRRFGGAEGTIGPHEPPVIDDLGALAEEREVLEGEFVYELFVTGDRGGESRAEAVLVNCDSRLPDLVVTDVTGAGVEVANTGDAPAGPFDVTFDGITRTVEMLRPGATRFLDRNLCEGTVLVVVDPGQVVEEENENNNSMQSTIIC